MPPAFNQARGDQRDTPSEAMTVLLSQTSICPRALRLEGPVRGAGYVKIGVPGDLGSPTQRPITGVLSNGVEDAIDKATLGEGGVNRPVMSCQLHSIAPIFAQSPHVSHKATSERASA